MALTAWGLEPEEDIMMPFNLFCKHWTHLLLYQFPDQYSDVLRLLVQSKCRHVVIEETSVSTIAQVPSRSVKMRPEKWSSR